MKMNVLGLGLILIVSFLDIGRALPMAWAYDLPAAQSALKKKEFQNVVSLLSPEVEKLNRDGLMTLARAYSGLQNYEAAIKSYTAVLAHQPKDFEAKTLMSSDLMAAGKDREALTHLKEALEANPRHLPAYKALTLYYEKKKNKYELRILFEDMLSKFGEKAEVLSKLCELCISDRLYDVGSKYCLKAIQLDPQVPENYVFLGISSKDTGKAAKAEEYLKKAANDFPKSELAQMTYAQHLEEQKNFIGAYNYFKRATLAAPESMTALLGLGNASLEIQKYGESLDSFQKACQMDKRKALAPFRRAANTLRTLKMSEWLKKFEDAVDKCAG